MTISRRHFIHATVAISGASLFLPFAARAQGAMSDTFKTGSGDITVHPIDHASFVLETPVGVIYNDPIGDPVQYGDMPEPDLILITHEHGDHYKPETLAALVGENTTLITNPAVYAMLPDDLKARASQIANDESTDWNGMSLEAIPAYNTTEDRLKFHPKGRDNGYILGFDGFRIYISADTENTPEMKALENIDLAFVCMNLPFTMDLTQAADGVNAFKPKYVYPYHYRGRDDGSQDPDEFAKLIGEGTEVKFGEWYS